MRDQSPTYRSLYWNFFLLGIIAFGPGMFALIHQRAVEQKKWLSEDDFREAVTFGELAPGPFTLHVVMYVGYFLKGFWGLLGATVCFSLPSMIAVVILATSFREYISTISGLEYFLIGVLAAILASMVSTVIRLCKGIPWTWPLVGLVLVSLMAIYLLKLNFIILILTVGLLYVVLMMIMGQYIQLIGRNGRTDK